MVYTGHEQTRNPDNLPAPIRRADPPHAETSALPVPRSGPSAPAALVDVDLVGAFLAGCSPRTQGVRLFNALEDDTGSFSSHRVSPRGHSRRCRSIRLLPRAA